MPPTVTGTLTASTTQPFAGIAVNRKPVTIDWHWAYSLLPVYPWLLLIPLFLIKANRSMKGAAVVVAAAASLAVVYGAAVYHSAIPGSGGFIFALTTALLMSFRYTRNSKTGRGYLQGVMCLAALLAVTLETWPFTAPDATFFAIGISVCFTSFLHLLLGSAAARLICRRRYTIRRLLASLALGPFVFNSSIVMLFSVFNYSATSSKHVIPLSTFVFPALSALHFTLMMLPFVLLVSYNSLYLERMQIVLPFMQNTPADAPAFAEDESAKLDGQQT